ncbi:MAG: hypothetical protein ACXWW6_04340, partial [Candidatus Limnocylindrales bacterium]
ELPAALAPLDLQAIADRLAAVNRPADWTHALMDLGSTVCGPRDPRCAACPVASQCRYARDAARAASVVAGGRPAPRLRATRERAVPFERSTRWLRGRIVDRLREVDGTGWATFDRPLGDHDRATVIETVRNLAREGLAELDGESSTEPSPASLRARLPLA